MRWADIRRWVFGNLGLRLLSIVLASGLWMFVNTGQHEAETTMQVPVEYRALPPGLVIVNQHPDFVEVQIGGPRTLLSLLNPNRLTVRLDLRGVTLGVADCELVPELFGIRRQT